MREILFRGKREDTGEWIEGNLLFDPDLGSAQIIGFEYWTSETGIERGEFFEFVDRKTVGQYTGLADKNGKRIFEGDCINHPLNVVEYGDGGFCVAGDRPLSMMAKYGEVIGNIHDNQELMEGKS